MVFIISVLFTRVNYSYVMRLINYIFQIGIPAESTIDQDTISKFLIQFYNKKNPLSTGLEDSDEIVATFSSEDDDATENLQKLVNSLKATVRR